MAVKVAGELEKVVLAEVVEPVPLPQLLSKVTSKPAKPTEIDVRKALWRLLDAGKVEYTNDGKVRRVD